MGIFQRQHYNPRTVGIVVVIVSLTLGVIAYLENVHIDVSHWSWEDRAASGNATVIIFNVCLCLVGLGISLLTTGKRFSKWHLIGAILAPLLFWGAIILFLMSHGPLFAGL